jgi:endonuclease/exonuclease/phosphatase (EEP) superfamily protein YafD
LVPVGWGVLAIVGWLWALAMLVVCALRGLHIDSTTQEVAIVSVTLELLLPSAPLTLVAVWRRRWALAAVSAVALTCLIVWEGPVLYPVAHAPAAIGTARIRLFDANVAQDNFDLTGIASEIASDRPDVVSLEELTPPAMASLDRSGVLERYKWRLVRASYGAGGMGVWADVPLTGVALWTAGFGQVEIDAWLHPDGTPPVRLDVVHVYAPVGHDEPADWRAQLARVASHLQHEPRPLLVAGDFNATSDDGPFQRILSLGLDDAAVLAGRGWEMTWPRNQAWVIPYMRIDHVLLSTGLTVTDYRLGIGAGSDHRPVIVGIAFTR